MPLPFLLKESNQCQWRQSRLTRPCLRSIHQQMLTPLNTDIHEETLLFFVLGSYSSFLFVLVKLQAEPPYLKGTTQVTLVNGDNLSEYEILLSLYCVVCHSVSDRWRGLKLKRQIHLKFYLLCVAIQ